MEKRLEKLHKKLELYLDIQKVVWRRLNYAHGKYYQSLKEIGINGLRDTEQRFEDYEIRKYLDKNKETLDIGANTGFFSIYLSKFVKNCECVEFNPHLVRIGKEVTKYLKRPVKFYTANFKDFITPKKYDVIISLAADEVADRKNLNFEIYIDKIHFLLKKNGLLFFESQAEDILRNRFNEKIEIIKEKFEIILKKEVNSTYPYNVPKRVFLIGKKK